MVHIVWERENYFLSFFLLLTFFSRFVSFVPPSFFRSFDVVLVLALVFFYIFSCLHVFLQMCFFRCIFHIFQARTRQENARGEEAWLD